MRRLALTHPVTDPASGAPFALSGRVVTMNAAGDVLDHGALYGIDGSIVDVRPAADKPPAGFEHVPRVATRGTLFPGRLPNKLWWTAECRPEATCNLASKLADTLGGCSAASTCPAR